ncbi:MAG TPA: SH3 domain-containing protein [Moorella mulderi]|nr:SH3 domain-containing protein [Moorella mulderi]
MRTRTLRRLYRWDPSWKAMILYTARLNQAASLKEFQGNKYVEVLPLAAGQEVAVLEEEDLASFINPSLPPYCRIKTRQGQVGYVLKSHLDFLK